jgi:hypothetical protein
MQQMGEKSQRFLSEDRGKNNPSVLPKGGNGINVSRKNMVIYKSSNCGGRYAAVRAAAAAV